MVNLKSSYVKTLFSIETCVIMKTVRARRRGVRTIYLVCGMHSVTYTFGA
jgi:hypothetical protein